MLEFGRRGALRFGYAVVRFEGWFLVAAAARNRMKEVKCGN
jgi:hypothetical protein